MKYKLSRLFAAIFCGWLKLGARKVFSRFPVSNPRSTLKSTTTLRGDASLSIRISTAAEAAALNGEEATFASNMVITVRRPFGKKETYRTSSGRDVTASEEQGQYVVVYQDGSGLGSPRLEKDLEAYETLPGQPAHVLRKKGRTKGYIVPDGQTGTVVSEDGATQEFGPGDLIAYGVRDEVWVVKEEKINPSSPKCGFDRVEE